MKQRNLVRQAVRGALMASASAAVIAAPAALAQSSNPKSTKLAKIEVVGSRILRTSTVTAQPVVILTKQQLNLTGEVTIGNILQSITSAGAAINTQTNNGNDGDTFVDLHNLGSQRVLILLNGHRWVPTLGGSVDLNTIPAAIIERVEILLDGAAPIYGSDAIAGVINIITVQNYNGAQASAYMGIYEGHNASVAANPALGLTTPIQGGTHWDGKVQEYSFTMGASNSREGVLLSVGYREQDPIWAGNRTLSQLPVIGTGNLLGSSGTPGGRFIYTGKNPFPAATTVPGEGLTGTFLAPGSCGAPATPGCGSTVATPGGFATQYDLSGPLFGANANPVGWTSANAYNYAPANYLLTPSEQWYAYTQGHYRFNSHLEFTTNVLYNDETAQTALAPNPLFLGSFGSDNKSNGIMLGISSTNPYNPFGVDLNPYNPGTPGFQTWCGLYGTATCSTQADSLYFLGRRMIESGYRISTYNKVTYAFNAGLKGDFRMLGHSWEWNVHYEYASRDLTETDTGLQNTTRMALALGPVSTCTISPGCIPLDLFGGYNLQTQQGTITPQMANYIDYTGISTDGITQRDYSGNLTGTLLNLPAGPLGVAVGYEYLEDDGYFTPNPLVAAGDATTNQSEPTQGREANDGEYIEFDVPLVRDVFLVRHLSFDIANRWTQATWAGFANPITPVPQRYAHNSSGRISFKYEPIRGLLFRGSWSQGFRVPAISEFFAGQAQSFDPLVDPCVGNPGLPNCPGHAVQPDTQIPVTVGGNANMTPERSISRTIGFVYSPSYIPGFEVSADYYKVEVVNAVTAGGVGPQNILDGCYSAASLFCNDIQRSGGGYNGSGAVTNILSLNQNIGSLKTEGWDANLGYRFPSTPIGDFKLNLDATFTKSFVRSYFGLNTQGVPTEFTQEEAGTVTSLIPKHRYNAVLSWEYGPWSAAWSMEIIGPMYEQCQNATIVADGIASVIDGGKDGWCGDILNPTAVAANPEKVVGLNELGTTVYNDIQVTYDIDAWNTDVTLGVRNLFDKNPPISETAFANSYQPYYYRVPGRFIYARVGVRF